MSTQEAALRPAMRLARRPKYLALALISIQSVLTYRRTVLINMATHLIWVAASYYVWRAVFAVQEQVGSYDWDRMRTYILLAYGVNLLLNVSMVQFRLMGQIRTGEIASELVRPVGFLQAQLALALGAGLVEGLFAAVMVVPLALWLNVQAPVSAVGGGLFILSVALSFLIKFLVSFHVVLLSFWTVNSLGLYLAQSAVVGALSGALIPLEMFPGWLRTVALTLPFQGIVHTPLGIYLGDLSEWALVRALLIQVLWIVIMVGTSRWLWDRGVRALEIQGG